MVKRVALSFLLLAILAPALSANQKISIFVDKGLVNSRNGVSPEMAVSFVKSAGFTYYAPRYGANDWDRFELYASICDRLSIGLLLWLRFSEEVDESRSEGRYRQASGREQPILDPNGNEFWELARAKLERYRDLSMRHPSLRGVFLDLENYYSNRDTSVLYSYSFNAQNLDDFLKQKSVTPPSFDSVPDGVKFLRSSKLLEDYQHGQEERWTEGIHTLVNLLARNGSPQLFVVYPSLGSPFIERVIVPQLKSDARVRLVLADGDTVGKPKAFLTYSLSILENRRRLMSNLSRYGEVRNQVGYIGGVNPVRPGTTPEYIKVNLQMIQELVDGYWVFFEGVSSLPEAQAYLSVFKAANDQP